MGRLHWIGGEKGGVGKSVLARLLVQYWIDRAVDFAAFDTDRSHGALLRHYPGYSSPLDVHHLPELDQVVDALEAGAEEVVVDLAAQTEAALEDWLEAGDVVAMLDRMGHQVWTWYVVDDGKDSVRLLSALLDRLPAPVRLVCVLNRGRARAFRLFDEAKLARRVEARGGHVIELPHLHSDAMHKIDAYDKSFWAAVHNIDPAEGPCLTLMERQRAKIAIGRAHATFGAVFDRPQEAN